MPISPIEDVVADMRAGRMVIMLDDANRENEGDLIMAAECVRPEDINFMARYGRGLICLDADAGALSAVAPATDGRGQRRRAIDQLHALDRGRGRGDHRHLRARSRPDGARGGAEGRRPSDLVQPGHIFPLMSQPGGTLARAGHTEAGCDLARLAGLEPAR